MKLCNEIYKDIFCLGSRPSICTKEVNICCLECDEQTFCLEKYLTDKKGIRPCTKEDLDDTQCEYLI